MTRAESLIASNEYSLPSDLILELTSKTKLSVYDAAFVALAEQLGNNLVTPDKRILKAVPDIAVEPTLLLDS